MRIKPFFIGIIILLILILNLLNWRTQMEFCDLECSDRTTAAETCGYWRDLQGCEPREDNPNWCQELRGGKCGDHGLIYIYGLVSWILFIIPFVLIISSFMQEESENDKH